MSPRSGLERYLNQVWYGPKSPPLWLRALEALYRRRVRVSPARPDTHPPVPVVVVGNLCVGGGGKTPAVLALVAALKHRYRLAIISRGYGGKSTAYPVRVRPDSPIEHCGDEAVLMAQMSGVPVWIDPDRRRALDHAVAESGAELVISDDGLQHQGLPRSHEICLFDGGRGVGNGHLLPAGPLRQPLDRLTYVDQVLIKGEGMHWPGAERFFLEPMGIRSFDSRSESLASIAGQPEFEWAEWRGRSVTAVCGIANPEQFRETLEVLGMAVELKAFPDHHQFSPSDFDAFSSPVVLTAKDAVKLGPWARGRGFFVLDVRAALPDVVIERVKRSVENFRP